MELGILGNLLENAKGDTAVLNFVKELSNYLENANKLNKIKTFKEIEKEYKLTYNSSGVLREKQREILKAHAPITYVLYKNPDKEIYQIVEYNNKGEKNTFYMPKEELPEGITVDKVIEKQGNKYKIDKETTKIIIDKLVEETEKIAKKQNERLQEYRKEENLYQVVDFGSNGVFLQDIKTKNIFEEPEIPQDLLKKIENDTILRYKNGTYTYENSLSI